ncbi:hypothetical protein KEM56_006508 [Ascosphaera pollenicola]|nr:hypothetical protein KEM56_006508 [Ascosphaera pollenicola]
MKISALALASTCLSTVTTAIDLKVASSGGNKTSPLMYGIIFEDINHSGDGGLHGQLLRNNGFQGANKTLEAYSAVGGTKISRDTQNPLTAAISSTLKVAVPSDAKGWVGFANEGYNGVPVLKQKYDNMFYVKGSYAGKVKLRLVGTKNNKVYAEHRVNVNSNDYRFTYVKTSFESDEQSDDADNEWQLLFDASQVKGGALYFGLLQLFPPTYHNRENGLRADVAKWVEDLKPAFLRFPGGNNLEGASADNRWKWNLTIGPVEDRPGRDGDWTYPNTDALGLDEYFYWCQDMKMEPLLAVWAGATIEGPITFGNALEPYIDDVMNELEYVLGDSNTHFGSIRAKNGRKEPWPLKMIEIGNEDNINGCDSYPSRFTAVYDRIHAEYPNITLFASTSAQECLPKEWVPDGVVTDIHHYLSPKGFVHQFNEFDNWNRSRQVLVGEYASTTSDNGSATYWQTMQGACSEAVYMIGMERNADVIKMSCYAPILEHFDMAQWSPNLFGLDSSPDSLTGSPSYYVQKMFSNNFGTETVPITTDADFSPVYWVATKDDSSYYVKLANYGETKQTVNIEVPDVESAKLELLSGDKTAINQPHKVSVQTQTSSVDVKAGKVSVDLPPYAVAVLVLN